MNERVIFDAALEIVDPQARRAFVEKACAGDPAMLAAVELLLKSHDSAGSFLDIPAAEQLRVADADVADAASVREQLPAPAQADASSVGHDEKTRKYQPGAIDEDSDEDADDSQTDLSFLQPSSKPGSIGVLAHYEVLSVLGQGAFGIVFKAFDKKLHRLVAIKVMNPQLASTSPPRKRFLREARAAAAIRHENVVQVYSVEEQPLPYLVMEFIDGQTLKEKLDGAGPLETPEVLHIARQIASGLAAAQAMGLIHRDIKPANILLEGAIAEPPITPVAEIVRFQTDSEPHRILTNSATSLNSATTVRVKISDFGLARAADDASMTRTGVISGTPMYMAPEQATGQTLDHRADLFSFGSVLYQMACGRPPFRAANTIAVLRRVVEDTPRPLQEILPEIPDWLVAIVTKLLAKKPEDRFQTAKEVADLLARCQSELQLNGQVTCVAMPPNERSRHAPRDEPNAPSTPDSQPTSPNATQSSTRSTPNETSTSTPRSAHHAERDGYVEGKRSNVSRYLLAAVIGIAVLAGILFKLRDNEARKMAAPGRPSDTLPNTKKTAEGGHPTKASGWHGWPADAPPPAIAPFDAEQAQQHQEAWAKYLGVPVEYTNSLGMKFRLITPGEFMMGSTKEEIEEALKGADPNNKVQQELIKSEGPQHKVILSQPIYLGLHEVTQAQYKQVMGKNPAHFSPMGAGKDAVAGMDTASHPMETVSWNDAAEFCAKFSQQEELKPFYFRAGEIVTPLDGTGYRLPKEAEWEFGCGAGTTTRYWIGDQDEGLAQAGWSGANSGKRTHAVGELKANPFGLYDIHGNVWEWVQDGWQPRYYGQFQETPALDPSSPFSAGSPRVFRGGSWDHAQSASGVSFRHAFEPTAPNLNIGFRVALPVEAVRQALKLTGPAMANRPKASVTDASKSSTAKPLTPLPPLDLDETDPLPGWELPAGAPPPVVAPCEPTLATERQQLWAEFLKRPVIEELDVAALAVSGKALAAGDSGTTSAGKSPAASAVPLTKRSEKNATMLKFALIPPGEFRKIFTRPRDPAIEPDMPVRRFRLTKPYALSTTEVTWDQFRQFVEATGYQTEAETNGLGGRDREFKPDPKINWRTPGWKPAPNEPVTQVTPRDAEAFCEWLTEQTGRGSRETSDAPQEPNSHEFGYVYRLPTEAEWVHACRAGSVHKHVVGPEPGDLADYAWTQEFLDPNPQASPLHLVAQKKPNPFGLHDTLGNVWEVTRDSMWLAEAPYLPTNDPLGFGPMAIVGSAWFHPRGEFTTDFFGAGLCSAHPTQGFRVLKQFDGEPLPGPLDRPLVLRAGQPLSVHALVPRPEKIPGLQSWSIELAGLHTNNPTAAIAASPKGGVIATGSGFGKISLWDRDGNYQRALLGHEAVVNSLDFSPDGRWLASCEQGGGDRGFGGITARVWSVETGALHAVIPLPGWGRKVAFSPTSEQLAIAVHIYSLEVLDLRTGQTVSRTVGGHGSGPDSVAWSPDGAELASSHGDNRLRIWDAKTLQVLRDVEAPASTPLEWSPDAQWLALRNSDGKVAIRDAKTLELTQTFGSDVPPGFHPHTLAWLPDSKRLVVASESDNSVFDATTGEQVTKFVDGRSHGIAVFDEGKQAVIEAHGRLHFYDTSTGQKLREGKQRADTGGGGWSALSRDGHEMFNQSWGKIWVNDAATGDRLRSYPQSVEPSSAPYLSPDGKLLAIALIGLPTMQIVDPKTGAKQHELLHGQGNVSRVAWSADGKWLATGATDKLVRVWSVATGKIEHELAGHAGTIWSLAWSPDGTRLASAAEDKTVRLWDPLAGKLVATYDQFPEAKIIEGWQQQAFVWTTDSRRLWIALTNNIVLLDVETGTFGPLENFSNGNAVASLFGSPDGQRLLARDGYGWTFVRGRDAQDRRLLGQHLGRTAQWHPDSRRFLGWEPSYGTVGFDVETNRRLGLLFPWLTGDHWLCLGPTGHYRGSPGVEDQIVYVAMLPDGSQRTYTPAEFAKTFNWKNDPEKAELLGK